MPVLQKAQEIYGYLPMEVQAMVAEGLGVSLEEVFRRVHLLFPVFADPQGAV